MDVVISSEVSKPTDAHKAQNVCGNTGTMKKGIAVESGLILGITCCIKRRSVIKVPGHDAVWDKRALSTRNARGQNIGSEDYKACTQRVSNPRDFLE